MLTAGQSRSNLHTVMAHSAAWTHLQEVQPPSGEVTCAPARAASSSGVASGRWLMLSLMLLRACTQVRRRLQPPDAPAGHEPLEGSGSQRDVTAHAAGFVQSQACVGA